MALMWSTQLLCSCSRITIEGAEAFNEAINMNSMCMHSHSQCLDYEPMSQGSTQVHQTALPPELLKELEELKSVAGMTYPELRHLDVEGANDVYPQDVEAEANEWFQKVYHEQLNIDDFVAMLKGWQVRYAAFVSPALSPSHVAKVFHSGTITHVDIYKHVITCKCSSIE